MNDENQAHLLILSNLNHYATQGIPRKRGDLEACLRYRQSLSSKDRLLFDDLLCEGNYAGREDPHSQ